MIINSDHVVFEWRGTTAPHLVGDFNNWDETQAIKLTRVAKNYWTYTLPLPRDSYMEYAFVQRGRRLRDRLNPMPLTPNGIGKYNNYFYLPAAQPSPFFKRQKNILHGKVTTHRLTVPRLLTTLKREVYLYQPPVKQPCPLIVVYDGQDYLQRANLPTIVDNLIAAKRMRPVALAMIQNAGPHNRFIEYACSDATINLVAEFILPLAAKNLNLVQPAGAHAVLGASMGGLMALYTALRLPEYFGNVISQSGAFPSKQPYSVITDLVQHMPRQPLNIWMDVGRFDFPYIQQTNPLMRDLLLAKGYTPTYRDYSGGHNWPSWRDELPYALEKIFG